MPFQADLRTAVLFYRELAGSGHFEPVLVGGDALLEPAHPFLAFIQQQPFYVSVSPYPGAGAEDSDAPADGGVVSVCGRFNFLARADPLLELSPAGTHSFSPSIQLLLHHFIRSRRATTVSKSRGITFAHDFCVSLIRSQLKSHHCASAEAKGQHARLFGA